MPIQMTTLKPGLLISLNTSIDGNTHYDKRDLEEEKDESGRAIAKWETTRTIEDPDEAIAATKIRGKCRSLITAVCSQSSKHGLLCPIEKEPAFNIAVEQAQALAEAFNRRAKCTAISIGVIVGRITEDDSRATNAIRKEIREAIERMEQGILNLDIEGTREAATKAKEILDMLSPEVANEAAQAISAAREAARRMTRIAKEGGKATPDQATITTLRASRFAFLEPEQADADTASILPRASRARRLELPETLEPEFSWDNLISTTLSTDHIGI